MPTVNGVVGIPWDSIRALTDPEFAAHWTELSSRVARDVGERVRSRREERRLGVPGVARLACVPIETLSAVELGQHPIDLGLLDRILAALGCTSADLTDEALTSTE